MDITPMSMQMVIPRATDATQVQHNLNHAAAAQHDFETMRQKEADKLKEQQVQNKDNADEGRIKDDPDRRQRQGGYGSQGRKRNPFAFDAEEEPKEKFAVDPARGHNLDIAM